MLDLTEREHAALKLQLAAEKQQRHHAAAKVERLTAGNHQLLRDKVCASCLCSRYGRRCVLVSSQPRHPDVHNTTLQSSSASVVCRRRWPASCMPCSTMPGWKLMQRTHAVQTRRGGCMTSEPRLSVRKLSCGAAATQLRICVLCACGAPD